MVELPHTIVGAAIAVKIGNPMLALPLALASHFVLDLVPHWNPHLNREKKKYGKITARTKLVIAVDTLASLIAGTAIASLVLPDIGHFTTVILASFLAVLPDVIEAPYFFLGIDHPLLKRWIKIQSSLQFNAPFVPGIISQIIVVGAAVWWIVA